MASDEPTKKRGRPRGRAFAKGSDSRRYKRPPIPDEVKDLRAVARIFTAETLRVIDEIMSDPKADKRARLQAAGMLQDRGWGRPAQAVTGENGEGPVKVGLIVLPAERDDD